MVVGPSPTGRINQMNRKAHFPFRTKGGSMLIRRKCLPCAGGKHSQCTGISANREEIACPCCGDLSETERVAKEDQIRVERSDRRYTAQYDRYASDFDAYVRAQVKKLGLADPSMLTPLLPKTPKEQKLLATELSMPLKWLQKFLTEHEGDYPPSL